MSIVLQEGNTYKVAKMLHGHGFAIGDEVELVLIASDGSSGLFTGPDGETWALGTDELEQEYV